MISAFQILRLKIEGSSSIPFGMPGLHTFRVRWHSLSGQLMPAKVPLWLSAQTTKTETIVCPGGT